MDSGQEWRRRREKMYLKEEGIKEERNCPLKGSDAKEISADT